MSTIARLSLEEYERMVEAGVFSRRGRRRLEFIRGEIRQMSPIGSRHADALDRMVKWSFASTRVEEVRVRVQNAIRLQESQSEPEPDLVWAAERDYSGGNPEPEDILLVVEVADSSLDTDLGEKAALYAAAGIRDYWVVDLVDRRIVVHRDPAPEGYRDIRNFSGEDEVHPLANSEGILRPSSLWPGTP